MNKLTKGLVLFLRALLLVSMMFAVVSIITYIPGVRLPAVGTFVWGPGSAVMNIQGSLQETPDIANFEWVDTEAGTVDAATGLPPVQVAGSSLATVTFWGPTAAERAAYATVHIFFLLMVLLVELLLWRFLATISTGDPFSRSNEGRLWKIAGLVGIGGTIAVAANSWLSTFLIERSPAAGLFATRTIFSIEPLIWGALLAVLATVWRAGVGMREDTDGLI